MYAEQNSKKNFSFDLVLLMMNFQTNYFVQVHYGIHSTFVGSLEYDTVDDNSTEVILGATLGCAAVLLICATLICYLVYRRKAKVISAG